MINCDSHSVPPHRRACAARKVCRCWSGGISVLVYEPVASAGSQHGERCGGSLGLLIEWSRWSLAERLVGSVLVVVGDVVDEEAFELLTVPDDCSVEEFAADGSDPAFWVGVGHWCPDRGVEDFESFGAEDLVEEQVAGCLGGLGAGWVGGGAGVEDLTGGDVDEEQHVKPFECGGVDSEEVAGDSGLGVKELRPGHVGAVRGRFDAVGFEDLPDGGRG